MSKGKSFEYIGAMDSVQITLPNCGTITADKGTSFEVCAADGKDSRRQSRLQISFSCHEVQI